MTSPPEDRDVPGGGEPAAERPVWTTGPVQPHRQPTAPPPPPQYGPPQYGPPPYAYGPGPFPYGPPAGTPPRKSRRGLFAVLAGTLVLLLGGAVLLVALLDPTVFGATVLDPAAVERDVAAQFQQREGVAVQLDCPSDMTVDKGAVYTCTGTTAQGENIRLRITVTDATTAAYTWTEP
ncbi:MAG TPA: DUF4333 domain-containing protein [Blastococcus sp.]|jgi:hypothetical protein|nr:DUF4333 domain-containing protein [Blastococcus sp.]